MVASSTKLNVLEAVDPPAIVKPVVAAVSVRPSYVLLTSASVPASVARVPELGKVTLLLALTVRVVLNPVPGALPLRVNEFPPLSTPVPPFDAGKIPPEIEKILSTAFFTNCVLAI